MNTKRLIERITADWQAMVICFLLALLVYIFHHVAMLDRKSLMVPLSVVSEGAVVPVSECPAYVRVTVRATTEDIAAVTPGEIRAAVNLNVYAHGGTYTVPVSLSLSPALLLMEPLEVSVRPESVRLKLEEKAVAYVPVETALSGEVEHGYTVKSVTSSPSSVRIEGPESMVAYTKRIYTQKVNVKGAKTTFSVETGIDRLNKLLEVEPDSALKVTVEVAPEVTEAKFENIVPVPVSLDARFVMTEELPAVSFSLSGPVTALEGYSLPDGAVRLDCGAVRAAGSYELPLLFSVPKGVTVKEKSASALRVVFGEAPETEAAEIAGGDAE